jgi:hypothetical protein
VKTGDAAEQLAEGEAAMCCAPATGSAAAEPVALGRSAAPVESGCC